MTDPLTGLYNRRGFYVMSKSHTSKDEQCVIAIDIDHFKKINDTYGHDAGDNVLKTLADMLKANCRRNDIVSRFGGEEFIQLLPGTTLKIAGDRAEFIREMVSSANFPFIGHLTVSAGVASLSDCNGDFKILLQRADEALYEAKRKGRNLVVISEGNSFRK